MSTVVMLGQKQLHIDKIEQITFFILQIVVYFKYMCSSDLCGSWHWPLGPAAAC